MRIADDHEILQLAQDLLDKLKEQPGGQQIINQTQTVKVKDVKVGRDFNFHYALHFVVLSKYLLSDFRQEKSAKCREG